MTPSEVLEDVLLKALSILDSKKENKFSPIISANVDVLINRIDKNKSLLSALVTSLVRKINEPKQDIRLHRTDFIGGYSARSLDTSVTAPPSSKNIFQNTQIKNLLSSRLQQEKKLSGQKRKEKI